MADITGTSGQDELTGTNSSDTIRGGDDKDKIWGLDGNDFLYGEGGNDYLWADGGDDFAWGGEGNDTLVGHSGNDTLYGGEGNDGFFGGGDHDILFGENGNDNMFGDGGNDTLYGGADNDQLHGGSGNDILDGGSGANILNGNSGNDTIIHRYLEGTSTIDGGTGVDTVRLEFTSASDITDDVRSDIEALKQWLDNNLAAAGGDENVLAGQSTGTPITLSTLGMTLTTIERVEFIVEGVEVPIETFLNRAPTAEANVALETSEDTAISGQVEASDEDGDSLTWQLSQVPANGQVNLNAATGAYTYTPAENFSGEDFFDVTVTDPSGESVTQRITVTTTMVADEPILEVAQSTVVASGANVITGTSGNDWMYDGGSGKAVSELNITAALSDESETLSINIAGLPEGATLSAGTVNADGSVTLTPAELEGLTVSSDYIADYELVITATSTAADGSQASTSTTISVDVDMGSENDDILYGLEGNDRMFAGRGEDVFYDGEGNDYASGGDDNDTFVAGAGNDYYVGGSGHDILDFSEATGSVTVEMDRGRASGLGNDRFYQIEEVIGSDFDDSFEGSSSDDVFSGGAGNDKFEAGRGSDTLTGGEGSDTFMWTRSSVRSRNDTDIITDFDVNQDVLDFSGMGRRFSIDDVELTETSEGTMVTVDRGGRNGERDAVLLKDVFGLESASLADEDWIVA